MEWVLQVVDEFDDAVGALRHGCLKATVEVAMFWDGTCELLVAIGTTLKHTAFPPRLPR